MAGGSSLNFLRQPTPTAPAPAAAAPAPNAHNAGAIQSRIPEASAPQPAGRSPSESATPPEARRPINPFLANDPAAKARRLARALVSDIVTYYPDKQREGVEHGTLKILFKDEIKKSYEEYSDQVGKEFAESTTYFRQALNEILARGQEVF